MSGSANISPTAESNCAPCKEMNTTDREEGKWQTRRPALAKRPGVPAGLWGAVVGVTRSSHMRFKLLIFLVLISQQPPSG
jgi:hypothetical protein